MNHIQCCLSLAVAMSSAGLKEVETYVLRHQNTITQYIKTRPILELYMEAERRLGSWVAQRWLEQGGLYLEGGGEAARVEEVEAKEQT